jgi:hypothetical protein
VSKFTTFVHARTNADRPPGLSRRQSHTSQNPDQPEPRPARTPTGQNPDRKDRHRR